MRVMAALQPDRSGTTAGRSLHDGATANKGAAALEMKMKGVMGRGVQSRLPPILSAISRTEGGDSQSVCTYKYP